MSLKWTQTAKQKVTKTLIWVIIWVRVVIDLVKLVPAVSQINDQWNITNKRITSCLQPCMIIWKWTKTINSIIKIYFNVSNRIRIALKHIGLFHIWNNLVLIKTLKCLQIIAIVAIEMQINHRIVCIQEVGHQTMIIRWIIVHFLHFLIICDSIMWDYKRTSDKV